MDLILLSLEVRNSFEHPNGTHHLGQELHEMARRCEDSPDFTEEDLFLSAVFEGGYEGIEATVHLEFYLKSISDLSRKYPDLVFSLDATDDLGMPLWRWYLRNGRRQTALPYLVVPDFDADLAGEEI